MPLLSTRIRPSCDLATWTAAPPVFAPLARASVADVTATSAAPASAVIGLIQCFIESSWAQRGEAAIETSFGLVAITGVRCRPGHLRAGGSQGKPAAAEGRQALAVGVARLLVPRVEVEGMPVVGDLASAVGPRRGGEQRRARAVADCRPAARPQRRPEGGAGAGARARRPGVLLEQ